MDESLLYAKFLFQVPDFVEILILHASESILA